MQGPKPALGWERYMLPTVHPCQDWHQMQMRSRRRLIVIRLRPRMAGGPWPVGAAPALAAFRSAGGGFGHCPRYAAEAPVHARAT
jgi:hypothetical protein